MIRREWTERERLWLAGGGLVGFILIALLLLTNYWTAMERLETRAKRASGLIGSLEEVGPEVAALRASLGRGATSTARATSVTVLMENTAAAIGLRERLVSLRPQAASADARVAESLEVEAEKLQLNELVRWLYAIKHAAGVPQVTQLRLRKRFDQRELFDVTLLVVRYRSGESS